MSIVMAYIPSPSCKWRQQTSSDATMPSDTVLTAHDSLCALHGTTEMQFTQSPGVHGERGTVIARHSTSAAMHERSRISRLVDERRRTTDGWIREPNLFLNKFLIGASTHRSVSHASSNGRTVSLCAVLSELRSKALRIECRCFGYFECENQQKRIFLREYLWKFGRKISLREYACHSKTHLNDQNKEFHQTKRASVFNKINEIKFERTRNSCGIRWVQKQQQKNRLLISAENEQSGFAAIVFWLNVIKVRWFFELSKTNFRTLAYFVLCNNSRRPLD